MRLFFQEFNVPSRFSCKYQRAGKHDQTPNSKMADTKDKNAFQGPLPSLLERIKESGSTSKRAREEDNGALEKLIKDNKRAKLDIPILKRALGGNVYELLKKDIDTVCNHVAWLSEEDAKRALLSESKIALGKVVADKKDVFERTLVYNYRRALIFRIATFDNKWVHNLLTSKNSPLKDYKGEMFFEKVYKTLFDANF